MATSSPRLGAAAGARYREVAFRRNLLGQKAPNRSIILIYFFLIGARSHPANFGHFYYCTVKSHASSGLTADRGDARTARGAGRWPEAPSLLDNRLRVSTRACGASISLFVPFLARLRPVNEFEAVFSAHESDRGRAVGSTTWINLLSARGERRCGADRARFLPFWSLCISPSRWNTEEFFLGSCKAKILLSGSIDQATCSTMMLSRQAGHLQRATASAGFLRATRIANGCASLLLPQQQLRVKRSLTTSASSFSEAKLLIPSRSVTHIAHVSTSFIELRACGAPPGPLSSSKSVLVMLALPFAGLADAAAAVYQCRRPGCHALVDAGRARAAAGKRPHGSFYEGDGCAGPRCATRWRSDRYVPRQCALAYNLFHGRRRLADWPARVGGGTGTRRSRASGARAALLALVWLQELGLCSFEGPPTSSSSAP
jgi:hypothetical protein